MTHDKLAEGISVRWLWHDEASNRAAVLRFVPALARGDSARWTTSHKAEMFVVRGSLIDDAGRAYVEGTFVHLPGDRDHVFSAFVDAYAFVFFHSPDPHDFTLRTYTHR